MNLLVYVQPLRTVGRVSGVGKHIGNAPVALSRLGHRIQLIAGKDQLVNGKVPDESPLATLPMRSLARSVRCVEWGGTIVGWPKLDEPGEDVDWVYCPADTYVAVRNSRLAVTAHTSDWLDRSLPWASERRYRRLRLRWRLIYWAIRRSGARLLCVSEFVKNELIKHGMAPKSTIFVVGNGVEDEYFRAASIKKTDDSNHPYILVVGGLTIYKGGDRVIEIARRLPDVKFLIVGDGDPHLEVQKQLNVQLLGYRGVKTGLPDLYANSLATLLLSRYETFGIPAAEAMAAGSIPIVGRVGALPEVVADAGCLVDADKIEEPINVIRSLLASQSDRASLLKQCRQRAEEFRWSRVAERIGQALAT